MSDPVAVNVNYSVDDYVRAARFVNRRNFIIRYGFLVPALGTAFILVSLYILTPDQFVAAFSSIGNLTVILVPLVLTPVWFLLSRRKSSLLLRHQIKKQIESSPAMSSRSALFLMRTGSKGRRFLVREASGGTRSSKSPNQDDLFFFTAKKFAMFIPKTSFSSLDEQAEICRLAIERTGERAKGLRLA